MEKEFIEIIDANDNVVKMEVLSIFRLDNFNFNYIIYCDEKRENFYVAKYTGEDIVDLDTNLSDRELEFCNKYFEKVVKKKC